MEKREGRKKRFLKALIHAAVGMYHLEFENIPGFHNYLRRAIAALEEFEPRYGGIDVESLMRDLKRIDRFAGEGELSSGFNSSSRPIIKIA